MKKTYRKVIFRTITHTFSRFVAIFAIVALGVGFLAGLLAATPDMRYSGDKYFDETNLTDIRIVSSLGLNDNDIKTISAVEGVDEIMAGQTADLLMSSSLGDTLIVRVNGLDLNMLNSENPDNYINRLVLTGGRMPLNENECVIELGNYVSSGIHLGDKLTATAENANLSDTMAIDTFTVVGTVQSSYYFSFEREPASVGNGTTDLVAYVGDTAFSRKEYSVLYVTAANAKALNSMTSEYYDSIDELTARLETVCDTRAEGRLAEVKDEANTKLTDALSEYNDKKAEADQKLADAAKTIEDGKKEIAKGERELVKGRRELADGEKKLEQARIDFSYTMSVNSEKLSSGRTQLAEGKQKIADNELLIKEQSAILDDAIAQYNAGKAELDKADAAIAQLTSGIDGLTDQIAILTASLVPNDDAANAPINAQIAAMTAEKTELQARHDAIVAQSAPAREPLSAAKAQIDSGTAKLAQGKADLAAGKAEIASSEQALIAGEAALSNAPSVAQAEFANAQAELAKGRREITNGEKELADAKIKLTDGEATYNKEKRNADIKLGDAEDKLADAEKKIRELELPDYYVLDRTSIVSFSSFDGNISKVEAIARVFPAFFFLVAALVALTTMTRMVEEERGQIGTLKALGYSNKTIAYKYMLYAFLASAAGCVAGLAIGFNLLPRVIWNAYTMMYNLPPLICQFNIKYALIASGVSMACTMLATLNACWSSLKESPATLMLPRAPMAGKRILLERFTFIWKRMKFTYKVTARNIFRYKKRFFMTVIGIAGCTALLVTGFGLRDSISGIIDKQFDEIFLYKLAISGKSERTLASDEFTQIVDDKSKVSSYALIHQEKSSNTFDGQSASVYFIVPKDINTLPTFIDLHERKGKEAVNVQTTGAVITEKLATRAGVSVGDTITLQNNNKRKANFTVTGIAENYVENYVYLSGEQYTSSFGEAPLYTGVYALPADDTVALHDELAASLLECDGVNNVTFIDDMRSSFDDMLRNITYVVYVLIVSAAALAFVVLYNLTNINIAEREKEIATIKVLGFFDKEVNAYVYRESAMLSLIGTMAGLVLGVFLHQFVIRTAEVDAVMFGREIKAISFVISAALTIFFSVLVSFVMRRKLKNISMVESMKAPE